MIHRCTTLGLYVFAVAALLAPVSASAQTTYYVSTSGSDANIGTQGSPVRTIQRGVTLATNSSNASGLAAGVLIAAGTYRESVNLPGQKTDAALTIEGAGPTTILTGLSTCAGAATARPARHSAAANLLSVCMGRLRGSRTVSPAAGASAKVLRG